MNKDLMNNLFPLGDVLVLIILDNVLFRAQDTALFLLFTKSPPGCGH